MPENGVGGLFLFTNNQHDLRCIVEINTYRSMDLFLTIDIVNYEKKLYNLYKV